MENASMSIKNDLLTVWVNEYTNHLFNYAKSKTSSAIIAEDLVQDTFLTAFQAFDKFEGRSSPKTWLFSILNHKIIDYYRKNNKSELSLDQLSENVANNVADSFFDSNENWNQNPNNTLWNDDKNLLDDSEFNAIFIDCIGHLPDNWRLAISTKYIFNKNSDEICKELNISMSNYWQIIHRAKLLLKRCIENNWEA